MLRCRGSLADALAELSPRASRCSREEVLCCGGTIYPYLSSLVNHFSDCVVFVKMKSFISCLVALSMVMRVCCLSNARNFTFTEGIEVGISRGSVDIDPRFTMRGEVMDYTMTSHSIYMNAIAYMSTLSQADFYGNILTADIVSMQPWDDVGISVIPTGRDLQRRYVLWGIYKALDFVRARDWHAVNFYIMWDGITVGQLQLSSISPGRGDITATCGNKTAPKTNFISPEWNGKINCINNLYSSDLDSASNSARITVSPLYLSNARPLSADRIYNSMAGLITHIAQDGSSNRLDNLRWSEDDYDTDIDMTNVGPETMGSRTYTNGMSTKAMWKMALWIERQSRYDECKTQVKLSGRNVGRIEILASGTLIVS